MAINKLLDIIKYKNRDLLLAFLRRNSNNDPIYYEDIEQELSISKDYLCQLLRPLKKMGLVFIKNIDVENARSPRKEIYLTEFGVEVVDYIFGLWLKPAEISKLHSNEIINNGSDESFRSKLEDLINVYTEDVVQIISEEISGFLTHKILKRVIAKDIVSRVSTLLLEMSLTTRKFPQIDFNLIEKEEISI